MVSPRRVRGSGLGAGQGLRPGRAGSGLPRRPSARCGDAHDPPCAPRDPQASPQQRARPRCSSRGPPWPRSGLGGRLPGAQRSRSSGGSVREPIQGRAGRLGGRVAEWVAPTCPPALPRPLDPRLDPGASPIAPTRPRGSIVSPRSSRPGSLWPPWRMTAGRGAPRVRHPFWGAWPSSMLNNSNRSAQTVTRAGLRLSGQMGAD